MQVALWIFAVAFVYVSGDGCDDDRRRMTFLKVMSRDSDPECCNDNDCRHRMPECPYQCTTCHHYSCSCNKHYPKGLHQGTVNLMYFGTAKSYREAVIICKAHGRKLIPIDSETELRNIQAYIANNLKHQDISRSDFYGYWVDKTYTAGHHYTHSDGSASSFLHWHINEPDNKDQHRCIKLGICSLFMDDIHCENQVNRYGVICKKDYCSGQPCQNGGHCDDHFDDFSCGCPSGYTLKDCSRNIDDCKHQPCMNGGTCVDKLNGYTCQCIPGYEGQNCTQDRNDCRNHPCQNGATCVDHVNSYSCKCAQGYEGQNCTNDIDDCRSQPCQNGGTCVDKLNGYTCNCTPGFDGHDCSHNVDDCNLNPCQNGGTCVDKINGYTCRCTPGFDGHNCSQNVDDCKLNPCQNGGTCVDKINGYTCRCKTGFDGHNCSQSKPSSTLTSTSIPKLQTTGTLTMKTTAVSSRKPSTVAIQAKTCYQCGNRAAGIPCSPRELFDPRVQPRLCGVGEHCMTDVYQTNGNQVVYKRCVDQLTCVRDWLQQTSDKDYCVRLGHVQVSGDYKCHFCCVTDGCNSRVMPPNNNTLYVNGQ